MEMYHFYLQITFNFLHVKICRTVNGLDRFTEEMFVIQRRYILVYFIMQLCQDYGLAQQRAKEVKTKMQNLYFLKEEECWWQIVVKQCDHMDRLFFQFLATYKIEDLFQRQ